MQNHVKVYFEHFGYDTSSFMPCELCGKRGNQIHHIEPRSAFGSKRKHLQDDISNLASLCFECHERAHGPECRAIKETLKEVVKNRL
jgi:5-methylcytosine-specific restriction endonuclease McrA